MMQIVLLEAIDRLSSNMLRFADLGIDDVQVVEEEVTVATSLRNSSESRRRLQFIHRIAQQELPFDLIEESAGTQTWFALIGPALSALCVRVMCCYSTRLTQVFIRACRLVCLSCLKIPRRIQMAPN